MIWTMKKTSTALKFADDTKVFIWIKIDGDRHNLKDDLNKLIKWSVKRQMVFNFGKYKCLHTGHGNEDVQYTLVGLYQVLPTRIY